MTEKAGRKRKVRESGTILFLLESDVISSLNSEKNFSEKNDKRSAGGGVGKHQATSSGLVLPAGCTPGGIFYDAFCVSSLALPTVIIPPSDG